MMYSVYFSILVLIAAIAIICLNIIVRKTHDLILVKISLDLKKHNEDTTKNPLNDCANIISYYNTALKVALLIASIGLCILTIVNFVSNFVYAYEFFISEVIFVGLFTAIILYIAVSLDYFEKKYNLIHDDIHGYTLF